MNWNLREEGVQSAAGYGMWVEGQDVAADMSNKAGQTGDQAWLIVGGDLEHWAEIRLYG